MSANYLIELVLRTRKEGHGGQEVSEELKSAGESAKKSGGLFKELGKNWQSIVGAGAAVTGAALAVKKAFDMGREGAVVMQTAESFDFLMQKVGASASIIEDLRKASRGTIADMDLMSATSTLLAGAQGDLATSLANSTPQLLEIAKAANKLNPSLGSTTFLYESLATGIKRSSPLILDNLGLTIKIGDANEKFAKSIGKTVEQLTGEEQQMALLQATLSAGDTLIGQVGGSTDSMVDSFDQATAAIKNVTDQLKAQLAPAVGSAATEFSKFLMVASGQLPDHLTSVARASLDAGASFEQMAEDARKAKVEILFGTAAEKSGFAIMDLRDSVKLAGDELTELGIASGATWPEIQKVAEAIGTDLDIDDWEKYYKTVLNVDNAVEPWVERQREADAWQGHLTASTLGLSEAMAGGVVAINASGEALDLVKTRAEEAEAANALLAESVENVMYSYEGFYGSLSGGLIAMRELNQAQQQSTEEYSKALAELQAEQKAVSGKIKLEWENSMPSPTSVKDKLGQTEDAWDEWGLRIQDIIANGVSSPWYAALQEMGMSQPPDTGVRQWAEQLKTQFYEGELPGLINTQAVAWQENTAKMKAAQAEATANYQAEVGNRKAAIQEEIDALNAAHEAELAAQQEQRNRMTAELALSLAEQTGLLQQWSQQQFGPDFSVVADSASEVLSLLDSGMLEIDGSLQEIIKNMTAGIQTALDTTGAQAEETKTILDGIVSTDWVAQTEGQLSQALDMSKLIDPEGATVAMQQVESAIATGLPDDPFAGLMTSFTGAQQSIMGAAGEMESTLSLAFGDIGASSGTVAAAILDEWTGNSVFPDLITGGQEAEQEIGSGFEAIGSASQAAAAIAVEAFNRMNQGAREVVGGLQAAKQGIDKTTSATGQFISKVDMLITKLKILKGLLEGLPTTIQSPPPAAEGMDVTSTAAENLAKTVSNKLGVALASATSDATRLTMATGRLNYGNVAIQVPSAPIREAVGIAPPPTWGVAAPQATRAPVSVGGDTHNWYIQDQGAMALAMTLVQRERRNRLNDFMGG